MNTLKEYRIRKNYSCQMMANMLKISKTYYWQLEQRKRRMTYDMAIRIAKIFNVKPDDLFYEDMKK